MTAAIVVGYGSIGRRHAKLLRELGYEVAVVSRRNVDYAPSFSSLAEALSARETDYVVIANETSQHIETLRELAEAKFSGRVLVEKPLGELGEQLRGQRFSIGAVGYNLRFHPALVALYEKIGNEPIISIQIYCGQYLPSWRPDTDYRQNYSAQSSTGGGVLRDLSHEIDCLLWLSGGWLRLSAIGGRFSKLEISSDDCWAILAETERCRAATVQINYLDRPGRRQIVANTSSHTYVADLVAATLECDGEVTSFKTGPDYMYLAQHRAVLAGAAEQLCSLNDGEKVMQFIAAAERSARERSWVSV
jgi:predicted dehydrogenase